ncbi:MAG: hypothetical protein V4685_18745, partial [Bacteroidota bacterium]
MKVISPFFSIVLICTVIASCNSNDNQQKEQVITTTDSITTELKKIDSLLQDKSFAESMAAELEASYYKGVGEAAPPFLKPGEDSLQVEKSVKEEKIATSVAGFYALECGINYLCAKDDSSPAEWIEKIVLGKTNDKDNEILNRFANATWKAGQPYRSIDRIKRPNFIGWSGLSKEEVAKDHRQIVGAATKLQPLVKGTRDE